MKRLSKALPSLYLGLSLSFFAHVDFLNWRFWAIIIPFFILVQATGFNKDEE